MTQENSQTRYRAKNIVQYQIQLNRKTEQNLIDHLQQQPNKQGYLKALIKADIENSKGVKKNGT